MKHAKASNAWIKLSMETNMVKLIVKDDGIGFDSSTKRKGIGLKNIGSRAGLFKGEVNIVASPGKGCEMQVKLNVDTQK